MIGYITIGVSDIDKASSFYDDLLAEVDDDGPAHDRGVSREQLGEAVGHQIALR